MIDTQGMSAPVDGPVCSTRVDTDTTHLPFQPKVYGAFTDREREELKQIMREVLDEKTNSAL
jgi:hypothetical protein|tara:strand:- start:43 stop:228 length:186 start_codon:yes stop_codon:yes gene_type:complete